MRLDTFRLKKLMESFYTLTGIKIVVFDQDGNEMAAYPEGHCNFCALMRSRPDIEAYCHQSDKRSFEICRKRRETVLYRCHAGLLEAAAPLERNGVVFGYIMFGQVSDDENTEHLRRHLQAVVQEYGLSDCWEGMVLCKTQRDIEATVDILKACTSYLLLREMISPENLLFLQQLDQYVEMHLSEDIEVETLCKALSVSRTRLYEITSQYLAQGVARHVREKRIEAGKRLLTDTRYSVCEIAAQVGFADYNYFCRVFKQVTGMPAKKFRAEHQKSFGGPL